MALRRERCWLATGQLTSAEGAERTGWHGPSLLTWGSRRAAVLVVCDARGCTLPAYQRSMTTV